eukprot:TRINITY_DN21164_c0_g1_i1.p1 TRINITY_DN21164_c0_g1~~TRINITY_DN21164_c0_g1_i1.p1  ORF type:complete len:756 (+),score=147.40 TRINITY_DN21164_c0_g1_i1:129-2396(+)
MMDTCSSSVEDSIIKTRKPYTITKQRERWTEEEHNRFLEALKLYGRAWQRVEEHIGTKTAVQIRSHAQKFFSKLEKEALVKGIPPGQSHDIDIPPPRPKRKPSAPYPRKTTTGVVSSPAEGKDGRLSPSVSSLYTSKHVLDLESYRHPEKPAGTETFQKTKDTSDEGNCSEVLTLFHEVACASVSSASKSSASKPLSLTNPCTFKQYVPLKEKSNQTAMDESSSMVDQFQKLQNIGADNTDVNTNRCEGLKMENLCLNSQAKLDQVAITDELKQPEELCLSSPKEIQATQSYPRHVPVHVVEGSVKKSTQDASSDVTNPVSIANNSNTHGNPNLFKNPTFSETTKHHVSSERSSIHQSFPAFHPAFAPFPNPQETYRSFLNISSAFSSLVISSLLQNPAVHTAASLAASLWPHANMETSVDTTSDILVGGFPLRHTSQSSSMAAMAAATVAAASAWWAFHGMLPLCPPLHTGFAFAPTPTTTMSTVETTQIQYNNKERSNGTPRNLVSEDLQPPDPEITASLKTRQPASKSAPLSPSDSEGNGNAGHKQMIVSSTVFHEAKLRKQVDRSSCGSNTTSSSEVETDILTEKIEEAKEESKLAELSQLPGESNNRRARSVGNINDSWKEVSEEGRLAFQALFSREVLPQSFSPPHDLKNKASSKNNIEEGQQQSSKNGRDDAVQLVFNDSTVGTVLDQPRGVEDEQNCESVMLKAQRMGFKPYKRCSVEAKEGRVVNSNNQGEEHGAKRIRLEGDASA